MNRKPNHHGSGLLEPVDAVRWRIPRRQDPRMRVDGLVYASHALLPDLRADQALAQVVNVACLPGIVSASLAMPDIHWGYGFPIGGVAAFDADAGVISPGGVGYDINCGVRLLLTRLTADEVRDRREALLQALYRRVPAGVGSAGPIRLNPRELRQVLARGAAWAVARGYGHPGDLERTENGGCLPDAEPGLVSDRALERGGPQLGTLGSGNHFLELQRVDRIFDEPTAAAFGLREGLVTVMIHCGSRGLGYQVCDDFLDRFRRVPPPALLPDPQLVCAPVHSAEGRDYRAAMAAAANYAWANRQCITHAVREAMVEVFGASSERLGLRLLYDVAHNLAKLEEHEVAGTRRQVCVHRKGATRAVGHGHPDLPPGLRAFGQPVLIPGSMGTASYVCAGTDQAMRETFGSTAHGAGRVWSRHEALKQARGRNLLQELEEQGVRVLARSRLTLAEEAPAAYKDVDAVVDTVHLAGLSKKVARLTPLGVVKG